MSGATLSAPWAGATVATVMPPLLLCPIATPGSLRGNNQCSTAESIQAVHALAGIQPHHPLIRGNLCLRTATTNRTTESLQPTYPCRDGDLNPRPSHQRKLVHALACTTTATWTNFFKAACMLRICAFIYFELTINIYIESTCAVSASLSK